MNIECCIGWSFAKSDVRGNSYIIFIWHYVAISLRRNTVYIAMKFAVIVARGLLYNIM